MTQPVLLINQLNKSFTRDHQQFPVLRQISLQVNRGEIVGVIGESGSGKTTLARIIAGLEEPDDGTVKWHDTTVAKPFLVQMIFQNPYASLYRGMSIRDIVLEPLKIQRPTYNKTQLDQIAAHALEQVKLPADSSFRDRYPHQLSGGQRQRVAIARALILKPCLLIADEPTSMLDIAVQADILDLLRELNQQNNLAILFITHNLAVASHLCSRIAVLRNGTIVENGPAETVIQHPQDPYTMKLLEIARQNCRVFQYPQAAE